MYRHIDAALKLNGMTRSDLAKSLGVSPSTLSLKLSGKGTLTLPQARAIKAILNIALPLEELFSESAKTQGSV